MPKTNNLTIIQKKINSKFVSLYGEGGKIFASAGCINLIGEHTDFNGGYVFPGAIDKGLMAEIKLNGTDKVRAFSVDYNEECVFGLNEEDKPAKAWACYIFGVCRETIKRGGKVEGSRIQAGACVFLREARARLVGVQQAPRVVRKACRSHPQEPLRRGAF